MDTILVVGLSTYDLTVPMKGALIENQKYHVEIGHEGGGGPAFNAAYLCAKWGANTYLRSCIGTDMFGSSLGSMLSEVGVHPDELLISNDSHTSYSYVFTNEENGNRTIMNFRCEPYPEHHFFPDKNAKVILTDGHEPILTMDAFAQYPDAVKIMDAGNYRENMVPIAAEVDFLVSSQVFAEGHANAKIDLEDPASMESVFSALEQLNKHTVVITMGDMGVLYRNKVKQLVRMPAFSVKAVDTTGAGDVFHGAFTYGIMQGLSLEENIKMSQMAAALSVQKVGSQTSIPDRAEVEAALRRH